MASKKHVAAAYTFLELQNMYSARLACHADSSTFQTKLCDMILHDTIDIQREDANRCSRFVELVVPNYNFILDLPVQHLRPFYVT